MQALRSNKAHIFCVAGFTLIELLVVIAIILTLAGFMVPAVIRSKALAARTQCLSNGKSLFLAARMFTDENNGCLPARGVASSDPRWPEMFRPYLTDNPKIYHCPEAADDSESQADLYLKTHNNTSYIINGFNDIVPFNTPMAVFLDRVPDLSSTILFGESKNGDGNFYMDIDQGDQNVALDDQRHNAGECCVFGDGHNEWVLTARTITEKMWLADKSYTPPTP